MNAHARPSARSRRAPLSAPDWVRAGLAFSLGLGAVFPLAHAQTASLSYRLLAWAPANSPVGVRETAQGNMVSAKVSQTVKAPHLVCLAGASPVQTLVQVQPTEGGEARYIVLGGAQPACTAVGEGWNSAATREVPWYKNLFTVLGAKPSGGRITASTTGSTRDINSDAGTQPPHVDPCDLFPTARGRVNLPSGPVALALATGLPAGTTLILTRQGSETTRIVSRVAAGLVQWPAQAFVAGDRWRIVPQAPTQAGNGTTIDACNAEVVIQPQSANPLRAAQEASPRFTADAATAQAALVAGQLDDANLAAWHAWLLSTVAPSEKAPQGIGPTLWRTWWNNHGASLPSPEAGTR